MSSQSKRAKACGFGTMTILAQSMRRSIRRLVRSQPAKDDTMNAQVMPAETHATRLADFLEASLSEMVNERAILQEQIKRIEQQICGIDRCIQIMTRGDKKDAAGESQRREGCSTGAVRFQLAHGSILL